MPGFKVTLDNATSTSRRYLASAYLRTPGDWDELLEEEKDAWNKATAAVNELMELVESIYAPRKETTP